MRTRETLAAFEEITLLKQYLYMSGEHAVTYNNGCVSLRLRMEHDLKLKAENLAFPNTPELDMTQAVSDSTWLGILKQLKEQKPEEITKENGYRSVPENIKTRWDEIREITRINLYENIRKGA